MKCDEAKPVCYRCSSTGRKCDGYAAASSAIAKTTKNDALTLALGLNVTVDALEKRTFDFFRLRTTPCMSGYFNDHLWERMVFQVCQTEPAVRYAVTALGALHEERSLRRSALRDGVDVSSVQTDFPVKQYAKALSGLQQLLACENVPMNVVLLCSLLCVHFESMRENFVPALVHAENAIKLLHSSSTFNSQKIDQSLIRAFMRIDLQGSLYIGMRTPGLPFFTSATDSDLPDAFADLIHARDFSNTWTSRLYYFMRTKADRHKFQDPGNVPLELFAECQTHEGMFAAIDQLLWDFMQKPTVKLSFREQHGLGMLRIRAKINRIVTAGCLYAEASNYDRFMELFVQVHAICKYIIDSENADRRLFSVSLDEGLLHPLFFLATHCRDSKLRHSALGMLRLLPARAGIWHVEAMTRTAEHCIEYEEALCEKEHPDCSDIPEWRRIHSAGFDGWDAAHSRHTRVIMHMRTRPYGMDGDWVDTSKEIEWYVNPLRPQSCLMMPEQAVLWSY